MATLPTGVTINDYIRSTLSGSDSAIIENSTAAAIWLAEDECQRSFTVATTASARTYTPDGGPVLRIHDCTTVTSVVENGATLTVATDYQLEPTAVDWAGHAQPYTQIRRRYGTPWYTDGDWGTVVVTATWGCLTVPPTAVEAMCLFAKDFADNRDTDYARVKLSQSEAIDRLLGPLRRVEAFGIA
jgi:hypothetical protein